MKHQVILVLCLLILEVTVSGQVRRSLDATISDLQRQIQVRESIDRDSRTPPGLRTANRRVIEQKRAELLEIVKTRISQLQNYLTSLGNSATPEEKQYVETSLKALSSLRDALAPRSNQITAAARSSSRPRAVNNQTASNYSSSESRRAVDAAESRQSANATVKLEPVQEGETIIRGSSISSVSEIVVEIRTRETRGASVQNLAGSVYSHATQVKQDAPMAYRVARFSPPGSTADVWRFTVKPLTHDQEIRAVASGNEANATAWFGVLTTVGVPSPVATSDERSSRSPSRSDASPVMPRPNQSRASRILPRQSTPETPEIVDQCADDPTLRNINVDWAVGSVSPSQLKRSGNYCVTVSNLNTILYSYVVTVESEEVQGSPFDTLNAAIAPLKTISGSSGLAPTDTSAKGTALGVDRNKPFVHTCELPPLVDDVKRKASDLQQAFNALLPGETGGKKESVKLQTTLKAWEPIPDKFDSFADAAEILRLKLSTSSGVADCTAGQITDATNIVGSYYKARVQYRDLFERVHSPHVVKVRADDLDAANNTKITVKESYYFAETNAKDLSLKVAAGYHLISASAGFLVTQVPARSYSSRTAPDPANPTSTQNVLGVDYGAGMRPALTALLHYNLPFIRQSRLSLALSVGPVYDISGGKADTSKFGFFGGVSARFSQWLYITPGFHIGEFADFPQGFTRAGQVIPTNTGAPVPVKRYTTRFAMAVTFKVKDLGAAAPPAGAQTGK